MKKILAILLMVSMLLGCSAALGAELGVEGMINVNQVDLVQDPIGIQSGTELTIGSTTMLSGHFATDMWDNNTSDLEARALLHGYSIISGTRELSLAVNAVAVSKIETQADAAGNRTYTITINGGLTYNDGTPITAKDYVFSLLLSGAPQIREIGGTPLGLSYIAGYDAYLAGETQGLSGVRLVSGSAFSITVLGDYLPYFYGLEMLNVTPYPVSVIAPGCDVFDSAGGAYIGAAADAGSLEADGYTPGEFSAEMLTKTMLDPASGYLYFPRVTSGPYVLASFDAETRAAAFLINPLFKGNYEGQTPHIERITFKPVQNSTMMQELARGDVGLLSRVTHREAVSQGIALSDQAGATQRANYPRTGFAFLSFACEGGVGASAGVRQAIAYSIDKQALVAELLGPANGLPVYGYYGIGQWMLMQSFPADEKSEALSVQEALLSFYTEQDFGMAEQYLAMDGWALNEAGEPFDAQKDAMRYRREEDGSLTPLLIRFAKTKGSEAADMLEKAITPSFAELGIGLEVTELPFDQVLAHYYRQNDRTYDMFFLASNFTYVFDPFFAFHTGDAYQGLLNTTGLKDEALMDLAWQMRATDSADQRLYIERWLAFQARFNELMPMVPLYSSIYFDFYPNDLQEYNITEHSGWAQAILYAYIGEPAEAQYVN